MTLVRISALHLNDLKEKFQKSFFFLKIHICRGKTRKFVKLYMPFVEISILYTFNASCNWIQKHNKNEFLANCFKICCTLLPGHLISCLHDRVFSLKFGKVKIELYWARNQLCIMKNMPSNPSIILKLKEISVKK